MKKIAARIHDRHSPNLDTFASKNSHLKARLAATIRYICCRPSTPTGQVLKFPPVCSIHFERGCQSCSCDALGSSGELWSRPSLPGPAKNQAKKRSSSQNAGINKLASTHNFGSPFSLFCRASVLGSLSRGGIWIQSSYLSSGFGEG